MSPKKTKLKSKTLLSRLGGVSAFGFGLGLKLPEADRPIVRKLVYLPQAESGHPASVSASG
jgi:hypothetical protein